MTNPTSNRRAKVLLRGDNGSKDQDHRYRIAMIEPIDEDIIISDRMVFASIEFRGKAKNIHGDSKMKSIRKKRKRRTNEFHRESTV